MLDREIVIVKHLRKLGAQESFEFSRSHSRCCHDRSSAFSLKGIFIENITAGPSPAVMAQRTCRHSPSGSTIANREASKAQPLADLRKIAVSAEPATEAGCARHAVRAQCLAPVVPLLDQRLADGKAVALDGGPSVGANADLRKARDLLRERFCFRAGSSLRGNVFAQADRQALLGRHFASRQDNLECAALPHNARQPYRASIDQRHAPSTAIDA